MQHLEWGCAIYLHENMPKRDCKVQITSYKLIHVVQSVCMRVRNTKIWGIILSCWWWLSLEGELWGIFTFMECISVIFEWKCIISFEHMRSNKKLRPFWEWDEKEALTNGWEAAEEVTTRTRPLGHSSLLLWKSLSSFLSSGSLSVKN